MRGELCHTYQSKIFLKLFKAIYDTRKKYRLLVEVNTYHVPMKDNVKEYLLKSQNIRKSVSSSSYMSEFTEKFKQI